MVGSPPARGQALDRAVHPLCLAVGPRMIRLGQLVGDAVVAAGSPEDVAARPIGCRATAVFRQIGKGDSIVR